MTIVENARLAVTFEASRSRTLELSPRQSRPLLALIVVAAVGLSLLIERSPETAAAVLSAGDDLTRLLRFMAAIKAVLSVAAVSAVFWRLGSEVTPGWFAAYGAVCAIMTAGPGLIWGMAHVGLGALLLHGGLILSLVLLWRDPTVPVRLEAALARRRARRRT